MTEHGCPECGFGELETRKTVEDNEVVEGGLYCPDCETEFGEDTVVHWDDLEFPLWIGEELRLDDWQLWRTLSYSENLYDGDYAGIPNNREMKCQVLHVWFKVTEDGSVEGPYDAKRGEKI